MASREQPKASLALSATGQTAEPSIHREENSDYFRAACVRLWHEQLECRRHVGYEGSASVQESLHSVYVSRVSKYAQGAILLQLMISFLV